jgi:hypothetical protein
MKHLVGGVLILLLAFTAGQAQDKPKDKEKPKTAKEQLTELRMEFNKAQQAFFQSLNEAKTDEDRQKKMAENAPLLEKVAAKCIEFAEKNAKDDSSIDALLMVISNRFLPTDSKAQAKAIDLIGKEHIASKKMGQVAQMLANGFGKRNEELLRTILAKNPHKAIKSDTCLALAQFYSQRASIAKQVASNADLAKRLELFFGKETADEIKKADVKKLEASSAAMYKEFADNYLADTEQDRLVNLCVQLSFSGDASSESLLRTVVEKDKRRDVQGVACLALGQVLKEQSNQLADSDAKKSKEFRTKSEEMLSRAANKFADVKFGFRGTVGETAKRELYELRHLSVGLPAPEIEGEDQDGKKFKLSDYKGKVVLLDFWSQF